MIRRVLSVLTFSVVYAQFAFGGSLTVNNEDIKYKWKDGDYIWYEPVIEDQGKKEEAYLLCEEEFGKDKKWEIQKDYVPFSMPCRLRPGNTESWAQDLIKTQQELDDIGEKESEKPPGHRLSQKKLNDIVSKRLEPYREKCPKGFNLSLEMTNDGMVPLCSGKSHLKCKKGFFEEERRVKCVRSEKQSCPEQSFKHPKEPVCMVCNHGGKIDTDTKYTSSVCSPGTTVSCATQYYCKVKVSEIKTPPEGKVQ